jgi:hypothetical protein
MLAVTVMVPVASAPAFASTSAASTPEIYTASSTDNYGAPPADLASALVADPTILVGGSYVSVPPNGTPNAVMTTPLAGFPTVGPSYTLLTTGDANLAVTPNTSTSSGADDGGGNVRGDTDYDVTILKVDINVPANDNCLAGFDFRFLSEEYPEYVGSVYNDAFIAELDKTSWTTSGSTISAPDNFAFDPKGNPITINAAGVTSMTADQAAGTTYDGATPLLSAATPITPGPHSIYFSIFDQGDHVLDSAVMLDNLRLSRVSNVATDCKPGAAPVQPEAQNYVALGDSYSSGEGNPPFIQGTDTAGDYCHRSTKAYPELLGAALGEAPTFHACSGAVTQNITTQTQYSGEQQPQIDQSGVDSSAALVTLTIGGNDASFADVLTSCIEQKLRTDAENEIVGPVGSWLGLGSDPSCADSKSFVSSENNKIDAVQSKVVTAYTAIKSKTGASTSVIAADYPRIFPSTGNEQSCIQLSPYLTKADQNYFNNGTDHLDNVLQNAAAVAGVNFVDVRGRFAGHAICGNSGSYLNALSIASGNAGGCTLSFKGRCLIPGAPIVGSFHPNASGHAGGYEPAFKSFIGNATNKTPAGYPVNPAATVHTAQKTTSTSGIGSPEVSSNTLMTQSAAESSYPVNPPPTVPAEPATSATSTTGTGVPDVSVSTLTIQGAASSKCQPGAEGTYRPGDHLTVTGSGFSPGVSVRLYLASPGVSKSAQSLVGQATADASGSISVTVPIPNHATGFTQSGAKAGIVFLDAIGLGSGGTHVDDVAMAGLAAHHS